MIGNYKVKPWHLHFAILGDYGDLDYDFDTYEEAKLRLEKFKAEPDAKEHGYFATIAAIKLCERQEGK